MPRWLGRPSETHFHVPKPLTSFRRAHLFDSRSSRRSRDISQSSPHEGTLFRGIANVQHSTGQTRPLTKGLRQIILFFTPPFFFSFFYIKENFQASFGNQLLSCEHLGLFHINVGIIVMHGNLSSRLNHLVSSMCLRQVFLGRLRDWVPICWLVTERSRASPLAICLVL